MPLDGAGDVVDSAENNNASSSGSLSLGSLVGPLLLVWVSGNTLGKGDTVPIAVLQLVDSGQTPSAPVPLDAVTTVQFLARAAFSANEGLINVTASLTGGVAPDDSPLQGVSGKVGQISYAWQPGDIESDGLNYCQVRITSGTDVATFPDNGYAIFTVTDTLSTTSP